MFGLGTKEIADKMSKKREIRHFFKNAPRQFFVKKIVHNPMFLIE